MSILAIKYYPWIELPDSLSAELSKHKVMDKIKMTAKYEVVGKDENGVSIKITSISIRSNKAQYKGD